MRTSKTALIRNIVGVVVVLASALVVAVATRHSAPKPQNTMSAQDMDTKPVEWVWVASVPPADSAKAFDAIAKAFLKAEIVGGSADAIYVPAASRAAAIHALKADIALRHYQVNFSAGVQAHPVVASTSRTHEHK